MICFDCGEEVRPDWCDVCELEAPGDVCGCCRQSTVPALRLHAGSNGLEAAHPTCAEYPGFKEEAEGAA